MTNQEHDYMTPEEAWNILSLLDDDTVIGQADAQWAVETIANADLLISDLPERELSGFWEVGGLEVNPANKEGEVLIEWEDESDYAYYGTQTRTLWLNRDQVLAILASAKIAEEQK